MERDAVWLFTHFWWLLFPIFGLFYGMIELFLGHARANRKIDLIKSYVDQGKEPPPELLKALDRPYDNYRGKRGDWGGGSWFGVFFFPVLALAFVVMAGLRENWNLPSMSWAIFVAIIMIALAAGSLAKALAKVATRLRDTDRRGD